MTDQKVRELRVANGSLRKRDLKAAGVVEHPHRHPDASAFVAQHFPDEDHYAVTAVRFQLRKSGQPTTSTAVREGLRQRGWLKEQRS
jgi:hypothetical protein